MKSADMLLNNMKIQFPEIDFDNKPIALKIIKTLGEAMDDTFDAIRELMEELK